MKTNIKQKKLVFNNQSKFYNSKKKLCIKKEKQKQINNKITKM